MILDGKKLAGEVLARAAARAQAIAAVPRVALVVASETPATASYLKAKERAAREAGCVLEIIRLPESSTALELRLAIDASDADAVVVQLPLPAGRQGLPDVDAKEVCDGIPPGKDADVLSTEARMRFEADPPAPLGDSGLRRASEPIVLLPPVAGAVKEILASAGIDPHGKRAVVLGEGWLVGRPCATWLTHAGADVIHTKDLKELHIADIVVSGMGAPHAITPELIKEGCVLVDAGTSEQGGKLAGDADPACAAKCALFTPCPGGVGPVAVAKLFENAVALAERAG